MRLLPFVLVAVPYTTVIVRRHVRVDSKRLALARVGVRSLVELCHARAPQTVGRINVGTQLSLSENRAYFGLWALMKAPLLLSANLPKLVRSIRVACLNDVNVLAAQNASNPAIIDIVSNPEVVAINQDALGVQARKLGFDGRVLPWLVGPESCDTGVGGGLTGMRNRGWAKPSDTRVWGLVRLSHVSLIAIVYCFLLINRVPAVSPTRPSL